LLAVDSCTRQHANLLVPGQIVSGLVQSAELGHVVQEKVCVCVGGGGGGGLGIVIGKMTMTSTAFHCS
jgi:hypothetical protein